MSRSLRAHLLLFGVVALWGSTFVLVKDALRDISPLLFNLIRMMLAFLCLAVVYRRQWKRISAAGWRSGALVGLFLAIAYQFQTTGLNRTTPSKSAFITGMTLVLVPLFAVLPGVRRFGAKTPSWNVWLGVLLAFGGVVLLAAPTTAGSRVGSFLLPDLAGIGRGDLLTLGCAFAFAFHIIIQDRFSAKARLPDAVAPVTGSRERMDGNHQSPALWPGTQKRKTQPAEPIPFEHLALLQLGFCTLVMAITMPLLEKPHLHLSGIVVVALAVSSIFGTAVAFTVQSWVQQFLPPTHLVLIYAFEPVVAWLTSLAVLHEGLTARSGCGAALILTGMLAAEFIGPAVVH
jgi:drug/metabolite transporter (DMT)-like permease